MKRREMKGMLLPSAVVSMLLASATVMAQDTEWRPVTGAQALRDFMSGLTAERELENGDISRAEYRADGTGTL